MPKRSRYELLMRRRIVTTFEQWNEKKNITGKELYNFLYKLRGIARGFDMKQIEFAAADKLSQITEDEEVLWSHEEWEDFLGPLLEILQSTEAKTEDTEESVKETAEASLAEESDSIEEGYVSPDREVILLIDKDIDFVTGLKNRLEEAGYHVIISLTVASGFKNFYTMVPSFVLMDIGLADDKEALDKFGAAVRANLTPLAFISDTVEENSRATAYEFGATDFIQKNILDPDWFVPYLRNRLALSRKILIDELTGACNRKFMERSLAELLANYARYNEDFSVAIIDLDFFKRVNDTHGHIVGDDVLKRLVKVINEHKRKTDVLCRFGGEEFVLCLPKTTEDGAKTLLDRIRVEFSKEKFKSEAGVFYVTFSGGIVAVNDHNHTREKLLDEADKALYQSKADGRNCITIYSADLGDATNKKLHVLVVDDDRLVRTILSRSFAEWKPDENVDVEVHSYKDGKELLDSDWYNPNDRYIILLDGIMPRMNGIEVLQRIRADYDDKNIIITMLSARAGEATIVHALEKGADDYMLKPFKVPEVLARVGRLSRRLLL